jgi:DNA-binding response OmpR family regulator
MAETTCAILLVEDDTSLREALADALSAEGFEVRSAANGRDALAVLQRWRPELILLDLLMPQMDGQHFRAEQRRIPALAAIPVIVLTAASELGVQFDALDAAEIFSKPCDVEVLKAAISRVLAR